jgi:uncharacterized protein (TIGR03382 family)
MVGKAAAVLAAVLLCAPARAEKCPNMMIMLDRSGSMQGYKWEAAVESINGFVAERQEVMRFGLFVFPSPDQGNCGAGLWKTRCDFFTAAEIADGLAKTGPGGMTPTSDALKAAAATSDMSDTSRRRFMILLTDGDPTCPDQNDIDGNVDLAVDKLRELLRDGVKTFVIGFGQEASPARLDRMAEAGGTPRSGARCTNPTAPGTTISCKYYEANDQASLSRAFDEIATIAQGELVGNGCDDSCYGIGGCPEGQRCVEGLHYYKAGAITLTLNLGQCVEDPCARKSCPSGQYCREGGCFNACSSPCEQGSVCQDGSCVVDPCAGGGCESCGGACAKYLVCLEGACVDDPCRYVECPQKAPYCYRGSCYAAAPTGNTQQEQQVSGSEQDQKRGCSCGSGSASATAAAAVAAMMLLRRRRS